jgi:hypothetical protein
MIKELAVARHKADVSDGDFEIYTTYHGTRDGRHVGGLTAGLLTSVRPY